MLALFTVCYNLQYSTRQSFLACPLKKIKKLFLFSPTCYTTPSLPLFLFFFSYSSFFTRQDQQVATTREKMSEQELGQGQELGFPKGCDSLLERCVHIMHTIDPIEKADLTLLLGQQWRQTIQARGYNSQGGEEGIQEQEGNLVVLPLGHATPPEKPARPDTLEFVRPGFGVKVGKAGSLCKWRSPSLLLL